MTLIRNDIESDDPEVVRELLGGAYADGLSVSKSGQSAFSFRQSSASDGAVTVSTLEIDGRVSAAMDGAREVIFTDIAQGRYTWRSRDREGDQERPLILPTGHELAVELDAVRSTMVMIDPHTVGRYLTADRGEGQASALLRRAIAGSEPVRQALRLFGQIMSSDAFESDVVRANLVDLLLTVTSEHLIQNAHDERQAIAPEALRRAEEYLRAHAAEPITTADAAAAARVSVRALQHQFARWRQTTPNQYLRRLRLDGARSDILRARDDGHPERVADVARRWGFAHLGRFSGYYADAFGESPSRTLGGRRGTGVTSG